MYLRMYPKIKYFVKVLKYKYFSFWNAHIQILEKSISILSNTNIVDPISEMLFFIYYH